MADVWPEYAAAGKAATTVRHVLCTRRACRPSPRRRPASRSTTAETLVALLAAAPPEHEPGTAVAEHALTYGHLCDEIVRRATGDDLADRFAAIAAAHGWDLHLRVRRRTWVALPTWWRSTGWPTRYLDDPRWGPALGRPAGCSTRRPQLRAVPHDQLPRHRAARLRPWPGDASTAT